MHYSYFGGVFVGTFFLAALGSHALSAQLYGIGPLNVTVYGGVAAFLDLYSTQPLLPLLTRTFGASTLEAGLTITAPTIAVAIFAPFIGRLADRLGLRRVIVLSAWTLTVVPERAAASPGSDAAAITITPPEQIIVTANQPPATIAKDGNLFLRVVNAPAASGCGSCGAH